MSENHAMRSRPFYILTCALAVVAAICAGASKLDAARAMRAAAESTTARTADDQQHSQYLSSYFAKESDHLGTVAFVVLFIAVVCWLLSVARRESGRQVVPLILLIVAAFTCLLQV